MDFRTRFPLRLGRPAVDEEVDAELEFHLAMRRGEMMDGGMTEAQAEQAALDRFGDYRRARRECRAIGHQRERQMRLLQYLSELRQDAAFSIRQLLANPGFSAVAIATLALGIGATTAIFSAVHAVVLRPLPVPAPERLVIVNEGWKDLVYGVSVSFFLDVEAETPAFDAVTATQLDSFTLAREGGAERVVGGRVTGRFFDVFGVQAALGRTFGVAEDKPGAEQVVVLSHRLWTRQFGGDAGIVGREITINGRPHTVLGVMPSSFELTADSEELWVPFAFTPAQIAKRDEHYLAVIARLRPDASIQQARQQLDALAKKRALMYPKEDAERLLSATPMMEQFVGDYRQRLMVLLGAVGFVLLIACGNVSNLLLARGAARARELALRSALGAGQGRLVRQMFTESMVLALVAAAASVALARWFIGMLIAFAPPGAPRIEQARIDGVALGFAVALALGASIIFGLVPAWRASRTDVNSTLKESGRGAGSRGARDSVRSALIAVEVALALVLLVGAGLLIRSALETQRVSLGFEPAGLFTAQFQLPEGKYKEPEVLNRAVQEVEEAVARIAGVRDAAIAHTIPSVESFSNGLLPEGAPMELKYVVQSDGLFASPDYFRTLQQRIVQGRPFLDTDRAESPLVVIINETLARSMWPGQDPIGKRLTSASPKGPTTVVGVVADVRAGGPSAPVNPTFYVPFAQLENIAWDWTRRTLFVVARTDGDPAALAQSLRRVLATIDPTIPLFDTQTMEARMSGTLDTARFNTMLLAILGAVGLLLAAVGIYGVISYFAAQRTSEIGIRMALGATKSDVLRLIVRQAATPVLWGVVLGTVGAIFAARVIATQLVNVQPTDPLTFAAVVAALMIVGLAAALIPARRAAAMDPTRALHAG